MRPSINSSSNKTSIILLIILVTMIMCNNPIQAVSSLDDPACLTNEKKVPTQFRVQDVGTEINSFLTLINNYRLQNGLAPLELNLQLHQAAQWMSDDMASNNYSGHIDSLGRNPEARMDDFGYNINTWRGENVAAGYSTAAAVFDGWKNSPGHDANMRHPEFRVIGIGLAYNSQTTYKWYWTTNFGGIQLDSVPTATATLSVEMVNQLDKRSLLVAPNPAQNQITFWWEAPGADRIIITIYNMLGERIAQLEARSPSGQSLQWDSDILAPGLYYYTLAITQNGITHLSAKKKMAKIK